MLGIQCRNTELYTKPTVGDGSLSDNNGGSDQPAHAQAGLNHHCLCIRK